MKNKDEEIELDNMEPGDWRFEPWVPYFPPRIEDYTGSDHIMDAIIYGMNPSLSSSKSAILPNGLILEDTPSSCSHEPIDVGFAKVKLVCKKCDKDL